MTMKAKKPELTLLHPLYYTLDGKTPVPTDDVLVWAKFLRKADRHVADETIGNIRVSTVFLGMDHSFGFGGRPLLFETMVFGGALDQECVRYSTWDEAEAGHQAMVQRVKEKGERQIRIYRTSSVPE